MARNANAASLKFFNPENSIKPKYEGPVVLIPKEGNRKPPLVGCLHSNQGKFLLTHSMSVVDLVELDQETIYEGDSILIPDLNKYHIISSKDQIRQFMETNGAKYKGKAKKKKQRTINPYAGMLIGLSNQQLTFVKTTNDSVFYLGFTKNPLRDLKFGAYYLTLDDILLVSKKHSNLSGVSYTWNGHNFYNNGVTYNTLSTFSVPLQKRYVFYFSIDQMLKFMEKEAKYQKGLSNVVDVLKELNKVYNSKK